MDKATRFLEECKRSRKEPDRKVGKRVHGKYGLSSQKEVSRAELFLKILAEENKKSKNFEKIGTERLQKSFPNFAKSSNILETRKGFRRNAVSETANMRVPGFEPGSRAWEARVLPLDYTRLILKICFNIRKINFKFDFWAEY